MAEIPGYPIATIAKLLDLSERHVRRLSDEGVLIRPEGRGGRWPITNVTLYIRYLRERAYGVSVSATDLHTEKIRIAKNTADRSEIELKQLKKEVVLVEDVKDLWIDFTSHLKAKLLNLPSKVAHQVIGMETYSEAESLIMEEVNEALEELAGDGVPRRATSHLEQDNKDIKATKETKGK